MEKKAMKFTKDNPLVFVTGNENKLREVKAILGDIVPVTSKSIDLPELQGASAEEISFEKCRLAAEHVGGPCICEDTSLCFVALKELPGPYIKWFLQKLGHDGLNNLLMFTEDKSAFAQCIFTYSEGPGSDPIAFTGRAFGKIVPPRGHKNFGGGGGFGWDPIFEYDGKTFAEMEAEEKNAISHRSAALKKLAAYITELQLVK